MSKKISLNIEGKVKPNLSKLFKKFIVRKDKEVDAKMAEYYKLFPFLAEWGVSPEDAELLLRYYGYLDRNGNIVLNPDKKHKATLYDLMDDDDFDDYEEIYPGGPSEDDDDDEDIYSELYPNDYWDALEEESMRKKKGSHGKYKHSKGKKNKGGHKGSEDNVDITKPYSQGFIDEEEDNSNYALSKQYIYFYPDYHDKSDRLEFNSLKEFDKFCSHNNFLVPPYVGEKIAYRLVSHVCLNPGAKERGVDEIMGSETYHDMFFEAGEELQVTYRQ